MKDLNWSSIVRYSLVFLIFATCFTDILTFFSSGLYEYEINPLVLLLKGSIGMGWAIAAAILVKVTLITVVGLNIWKYNPKPKESHFGAFMMVYLALFVIIVQGYGTYANMNTAHVVATSEPGTVVPMESKESFRLLNIITIIYYISTAINLLSFFLYEKIYIKRRK